MKLDPRIKALSDILTCFDLERAIQFIGQKGYFADVISNYQNLANKTYGTLTHIKDSNYPFKEGNHSKWRYFIPECFVKPKEKQYRPFTLNEFLHIYELGDIVTFRCKYNEHKFAGIVTGYETDKEGDKAIIHIGCYSYLLSVLFTDYERINSEEGEWVPFGVEVEQ